MSEESPDAARQRVDLQTRSRRSLEERIYLRFPRALTRLSRWVLRLPPRSRVRQALMRRAVQLTWSAANRKDWDMAFVLYHPEHETITPSGLVSVGFDPVYRGRDARIRLQQRWQAEWGELRFDVDEIIDLGTRVLVCGRVRASGLRSGAAISSDWAMLYTSSGGRIVRDQIFLDHAEALKAAGLSE